MTQRHRSISLVLVLAAHLVALDVYRHSHDWCARPWLRRLTAIIISAGSHGLHVIYERALTVLTGAVLEQRAHGELGTEA